MNGLLDLAIAAHGGQDRWKKVNTIKVDTSITGAIWLIKGQMDVLKNVVINADTKKSASRWISPGGTSARSLNSIV